MGRAAVAPGGYLAKPLLPERETLSHNLNGQRLGRKGQQTRERILLAALRLFDGPANVPITLAAVAREATMGVTTLYLYFPDLGDLVLAALVRVMDSADAAFINRLRTRWPDAAIERESLDFLRAHHDFWRRHARILHMRNSLADAGDVRFLNYRNAASLPLMGLLIRQMGGTPDPADEACTALATVLLTGFERVATVVTNPSFHATARANRLTDAAGYVDGLLRAEAGLIALAVRNTRAGAVPIVSPP